MFLVVVCCIVDNYCLRFTEEVCLVVVCYIVDNYCLRFTQGVCLVVVCYFVFECAVFLINSRSHLVSSTLTSSFSK